MRAVFMYEVGPGREQAFEAAYGPGGEWARLFAGVPGYLGTELLRPTEGESRYLVIDSWRSEADYDAFLSAEGEAYRALNDRAATHYERESALGRFREPPHRGRALRLHEEELAVCRLPPDAPVPAWAAEPGPLGSVTRTPAELSIVAAAAGVPAGVRAERGWRALEVAGPLDFALTGVLAGLAGPLAAAGVSVFALATYDTDYVLVRAHQLNQALAALSAAGHEIDASARGRPSGERVD